MYITQESDYAVRIIYCLARNNVRMDARTIGGEMGVSLRFALKILGKLSSSGLAKSFKGNKGGYELGRPAKEITLLDVINAIEGDYFFARCLNEEGEGCNRGACHHCAFQNAFGQITDSVREQLSSFNFDRLIRDYQKLEQE